MKPSRCRRVSRTTRTANYTRAAPARAKIGTILPDELLHPRAQTWTSGHMPGWALKLKQNRQICKWNIAERGIMNWITQNDQDSCSKSRPALSPLPKSFQLFSLKQQTTALSWNPTTNWKIQEKSGAKLDSSESADSQIQHHPTQNSPAASSVESGERRSWINETFKENSARKLRIQCLWADKGGVMLDLSSSSLCPHTARKSQPALNKAPQSTLSFIFFATSNFYLNWRSPNPENTSRQLPWELPGWKALIHGWRSELAPRIPTCHHPCLLHPYFSSCSIRIGKSW